MEPPTLLAYTWHEQVEYRSNLGPAVVRYDLAPEAGGTHVKVTHSGFEGYPDILDSYRQGWPGVMTSLKAYAERELLSYRGHAGTEQSSR